MVTLSEFAKGYEPKKTHNITDLKEIPTNMQIVDDEFTSADGELVKQKVIVLNGEKYRVPVSVIADLKAILEKNPSLTKFSVSKKGTGLQTKYTTIPLN